MEADGGHAAIFRGPAGQCHSAPSGARAEHGVIREADRVDAGDSAELLLELVVEGNDAGFLVAGLTRVQLEGENFVAVETELNGGKIGKRACEESGCYQYEERDRHLRDHQDAAEVEKT